MKKGVYLLLIMEKNTEKTNKNELNDYECYCKMMAQQQEEEMDEICFEEMPEGQFVRGH